MAAGERDGIVNFHPELARGHCICNGDEAVTVGLHHDRNAATAVSSGLGNVKSHRTHHDAALAKHLPGPVWGVTARQVDDKIDIRN